MQKKLVNEEQRLVMKFANLNHPRFTALKDTDMDTEDDNDGNSSSDSEDNENEIIKWRGILGLLCTRIFHLMKQDMCSNKSTIIRQVKSIITSSFTLNSTIIHENYNKLHNGDKLLESIYYIGGWLLRACMKASKRRRESLGDMMMDLVERTIELGDAKNNNNNLPVKKVERTQEFGALNFISSEFFDFILQFEHVFVLTLKPNVFSCSWSRYYH